jgi:hypothetical protein
MRPHFLEALPISDSQLATLEHLGASSPLALLAMRNANRVAFDNYVGQELVDKVIPLLLKTLTPDQKRQLDQPLPEHPALGARLDLPQRTK